MKEVGTASIHSAAAGRASLLPRAIFVAVSLLAPIVFKNYGLNLLTEMLILSIMAMGLNLLVGYTGLLSLGHALFFGIGGYVGGFVAIKLSPAVWLTLPAAMLAAGAAAVVVGYLALRTTGIYFLMATLALAQMGLSIVVKVRALGGTDGLAGIPGPSLGISVLSSSVALYYFSLVLFVAVFVLLQAIVRSPFGEALVGIRESEPRMLALGYDTRRFKLAAFVISGVLGGLAGAMYAQNNGFFAPTEMYWTISGQAIIMLIIGGLGTLTGPVLGAAVVVLLEHVVSSYTEFWPSVMGGVFILFVFLARDGLVGIYQRLVRKEV